MYKKYDNLKIQFFFQKNFALKKKIYPPLAPSISLIKFDQLDMVFNLLPQIPLGFSPLFCIYIYAVLLLPMLLLLTDLMPMLFPSALDVLVLRYKKG